MNKPHKHADLIHAWAEGAEIQTFYNGKWEYEPNPCFYLDKEYRIKPRTVKREGWVNIYDFHGRICSVYPTETEAQGNAGPEIIATVKVEWTEEVE